MDIKRVRIDSSIEEMIVTGMITSEQFMDEIVPLYDKEFFKNNYLKIISYWCLDWYFRSDKGDKRVLTTRHIWDYYQSEIRTGLIDDETRDLLKTTLEKITSRYTESEKINISYVKQEAVKYFQERNFELCLDSAYKLRERGDMEKAQEAFYKHKKLVEITSNWGNPLSPQRRMQWVLRDKEEGLELGGALNELIGPLIPGSFTAFLGPTKVGKTWALMEIAARAHFAGKKVAYISLEMQQDEVSERLHRRLVPIGPQNFNFWNDEEERLQRISGSVPIKYPVFDCLHNQTGACSRTERTNEVALFRENSPMPEYDPDMEYRPCSYCKENGIHDYVMRTWFATYSIPEFNLKFLADEVKASIRMHGDNIRDMLYPRFSVGLDRIYHDLDILEQRDGFIPDVILLDYLDITKSSGKLKAEMDDELWKEFACMIGEKRVIGATVLQTGRFGKQKELLDTFDIQGYHAKSQHVNNLIGINQTFLEKRAMQMRLNLIASRGRDSVLNKCALVLQNLSVGQFNLDSHIIYLNPSQNGG